MTPPQAPQTPRRSSRPYPREMHTAARTLARALAEIAQTASLQGGRIPYTKAAQHLANFSRALTGMFQFERDHILISWKEDKVQINRLTLDFGPNEHSPLGPLQEHLGSRSIGGLFFQIQPDEEQLRHFFRRLRAMDRESIETLGKTGQLATLPGERDLVGLRLLISTPDGDQNANNNASGLGIRTAFEDTLRENNLEWIGASAPRKPKRKMTEQEKETFCLGVYTSVMSTSLRLVRMSQSILTQEANLPTLALHRCIHQISAGYSVCPNLMRAAVILGARDPSFPRRIAHTAILAVGIAHTYSPDPGNIAEVGLAAFVMGMQRRHPEPNPHNDLGNLRILRLLSEERALTSLKVRAIHIAAQVCSLKPNQKPSPSARFVAMAADLAAALDGSADDALDQSPISPLSAIQSLHRQLESAEKPMYDSRYLAALARWVGVSPTGTVVSLLDGRIAVLSTPEGGRSWAIPLLDADLNPIPGAKPVPLSFRTDLHACPSMPDVQGFLNMRPFVDLAARALFHNARGAWGPLVQTEVFSPKPYAPEAT